MKKLGKLFAVLFILGISIASCSNDEYYEDPGNPANPVAPGPENPIGPPPVVAPN